MDCYSCANAATNACRRCARAYCDDHGNAQYCAECLNPASAMPSFNLYRGALLAMLIGTALAVFLIMRPAGETKGASPVFVGRSTPTATPADEDEPTIAPQTPEGTRTPAESPTPEVTAAPTEPPFKEYVVQDGDTLFSIAEAQLPPGDDVAAFAQAIATLNGIDIDDPIINPGQTLLLPKPPQ